MAAPALWPQADGTPVSCLEKLRTLEENHADKDALTDHDPGSSGSLLAVVHGV